MGRIHEHNRVAALHLEVGGDIDALAVTFDEAECVDSNGHAVVAGIVVGFPKVDLSNSGAVGHEVGHKGHVAGPSLCIGEVGEISIGAADRSVG